MKRQNKNVAVILLAIFLFVFFVFGLNIARMWGRRTWVAESALRVLLINRQTKAMELLVVWPGLQEPVLLMIPDQLYLTAVGGYGNYTGQGLLTLGQTDGVGEQLLVDSLAFTLGSPIHDVFWHANGSWPKWQLKWQFIREGLVGRRSLGEAIGMANLVDRVSWATLRSEPLDEKAGLRQRTEVDGSVQDYLDQALLMAYLERNLTTMWGAAAEMQVAIVNASNMVQMATQWSRLARINGFDVVSVTDILSRSPQTTLLFSSKDLSRSSAGRALATLYPLAKVEVGDTTEYRADAALLVGLDSWKWLNQRAAYLEQKN